MEKLRRLRSNRGASWSNSQSYLGQSHWSNNSQTVVNLMPCHHWAVEWNLRNKEEWKQVAIAGKLLLPTLILWVPLCNMLEVLELEGEMRRMQSEVHPKGCPG